MIHVTDEEETEEPDGPMSTEESFDSHLDSLSLPQHEERVSLLTVDTADLDGVCTKSGEVEVDKMIEEETSKTGRVGEMHNPLMSSITLQILLSYCHTLLIAKMGRIS